MQLFQGERKQQGQFVMTNNTIGIDMFGKHKSVRRGQIDIGRCDGQNEACFLGDELIDHVADLSFNI